MRGIPATASTDSDDIASSDRLVWTSKLPLNFLGKASREKVIFMSFFHGIGSLIAKISFILPLLAVLILIVWLFGWDKQIRFMRRKTKKSLYGLFSAWRNFRRTGDKINEKEEKK